MDDFLSAVNAYGRLSTDDEQAADLFQAFQVFDDDRRDTVAWKRLRAALTTLGDRLSDDDVDAMMGLQGEEQLLVENVNIDYKLLIDKLTSV